MQTVKGTRLRHRSDRKISGIFNNELRKANGQDGINPYLIHPIRKRYFRHVSLERFLRKTAELFLLGLGRLVSFLLALLIPVFTGFARRFRTFGTFTGTLFPQSPHAPFPSVPHSIPWEPGRSGAPSEPP